MVLAVLRTVTRRGVGIVHPPRHAKKTIAQFAAPQLTLQRYVPLLPARRRESLAALFLA